MCCRRKAVGGGRKADVCRGCARGSVDVDFPASRLKMLLNLLCTGLMLAHDDLRPVSPAPQKAPQEEELLHLVMLA